MSPPPLQALRYAINTAIAACYPGRRPRRRQADGRGDPGSNLTVTQDLELIQPAAPRSRGWADRPHSHCDEHRRASADENRRAGPAARSDRTGSRLNEDLLPVTDPSGTTGDRGAESTPSRCLTSTGPGASGSVASLHHPERSA